MPSAAIRPQRSCPKQSGVTLVVALLMLVVTMLLAVSGARIASEEDKLARSERDRAVAFEFAQEALADAETDIGNSADDGGFRSALFSSGSLLGFMEGCSAGSANPELGLCLPAADGTPAWRTVDPPGGEQSEPRSVPYGPFTGRRVATQAATGAQAPGTGMLPARAPRYIIEPLAFNRPGEAADLPGKSHFFLITAWGFGLRNSTQVVLQSLYRKED